MEIENIFSEDDEYEEFFHKLYDGKNDDANQKADEREVSLFGMSAMFRDSTNKKRKEDVFVRSFDAPAKSIEPYEDGFYPHNTKIIKKKELGSNFAFFGMRQLHMNVEKLEVCHDSLRAERERMLKNIDHQEEIIPIGNDVDEQNSEKPQQSFSAGRSCPRSRPMSSKKKRRITWDDSDSSEDEDPEAAEIINTTAGTRTRKRRSPEEKNNEECKTTTVKRRRSRIQIDSSSDEDEANTKND